KMANVSGNRVRIGRGSQNDVVLNSPWVADEAAVLYRRANAWELVALQMNEIRIGETTLYAGDRYLIETDQEIKIKPFSLSLDLPKPAEVSEADRRNQLAAQMSSWIQRVHVELLPRLGPQWRSDGSRRVSEEQLVQIERDIDLIARDQGLFAGDSAVLI